MLERERCDYLVRLVDQLTAIDGWFTGAVAAADLGFV
jgi:hypothetical protein